MTVPQREHHYDQHLSDGPQRTSMAMLISFKSERRLEASGSNPSGGAKGRYKSPSKSPKKPASKTGFKPLSFVNRNVSAEEKNVFWHSYQPVGPPSNFSPGMSCGSSRSM